MAVALAHVGGLVGFGGVGTGGERALVAAEAHGGTLIDDVLLLLHDVDHRMRGVGVKLGGVGPLQLEDVAAVFDDRDLQPQAQAVIGNVVFAGVFGRRDFSLGAAVTEAARDQNAVEALEQGEAVFLFQVLGVDAHDVNPGVVGDAGVGDRLVDGFVGVLELDVFADHADFHLVGGGLDAADNLVPDVFLGRRVLQAEEANHKVVHALFLQGEGQFVDGIHVAALDHGFDRDVAEHGNLVAQASLQRVVATAHEDVGLDTDLAQLGDGLLSRLGLELAGRLQVRDQGDMDKNAIVRPDLEGELAHRFEERQALDVAGGAADLGDEDIDILTAGVDALLDLVGHVRDHLHGFAEVNPAALLGDDTLVDLAGAQRVELGQLTAGEALVVAEVEIGLGAVLQDIDFAVLERAHRARIDVEVGVELLDAHGQTAQLQKRTECGSRQAFAQRRDHSARHEDVFHR